MQDGAEHIEVEDGRQAGEVIPIQPNGIYTKQSLAAVIAASVRSVSRYSGLDTNAVEKQTVEGKGSVGDLPPPFFIGGQPRWLGLTLIEFFAKRQADAIRAREVHQ